MKHLTKLLLFIIYVFINNISGIAQSCLIKGSFVGSTTERRITLLGERINLEFPIDQNGKFSGMVDFGNPTWALIHTENSSSWMIWLDTGTIELVLQERIDTSSSGVQRYLTIASVEGPYDTEAREYFITRSNQLEKRYKSKDSVAKYMTLELEAFIRARPGSQLIPFLLRVMTPIVGIEQGERLLNLASNEIIGGEDTIALNSLYKQFDRLKKLSPGKLLPSFKMKGIDGVLHSLDEVNADFIVLHFWASWCVPCRTESPIIRSLLDRTSRTHLQMVHISLDHDPIAWRKAIVQDGLQGLHLSELNEWQNSLAMALSIDGVPFVILLNKKGEVVEAGITMSSVEEIIRKR